VNVPENKDVFSLEAEVSTLKKTLLKERTEFERYISKVEKTKSTLNQELGKVNKRFEGKRKVKTTKEIRRQTGARTEKKAQGIYIPGDLTS
jgi:DNA gyrase/topoisomerase IV subunit A